MLGATDLIRCNTLILSDSEVVQRSRRQVQLPPLRTIAALGGPRVTIKHSLLLLLPYGTVGQYVFVCSFTDLLQNPRVDLIKHMH